jgi:hypothetical protein
MNNIKKEEKKKKIIEGFSIGGTIFSIVHCIAFIYAIFLSFRCNETFNLLHFLIACCCPYFYIIYYFVSLKNIYC